MPTLHIQLLGDFNLHYGDMPLRGWSSTRLQSLLTFLLLHRQTPQNRQQLAFQFWPDTTEAKARANLRFFLHRLRRALPDADLFLQTDESDVRWRTDAPFTLDVAAFENALTEANAVTGEAELLALERAVSSYRGELVPSCYDDWILPERERLRQLHLDALGHLVRNLEQQHRYRAALDCAQQLLRADPLQEETYRHLMRLHLENGDHVSAIRAYHSCAAVLERELAVEPGPETRALYQQLLQDRPQPEATAQQAVPGYAAFPAPGAPPNNLRPGLTSFIGREKEIGEVKRLLAATRLLTLTGVGGCGKTRLALQVAAQLLGMANEPEGEPRHADGVWLVELAALQDPALVVQTVTAVLDVREHQGKRLTETLVETLQAKQLLLVLDNCEHLIGACAELADTILRACPHVRILATSREPLRIEGELSWSVPTLALPKAPRVPNADGYAKIKRSEAVRLFCERAALALPTFELTRENAAAVVQICSKLDGLPLAIELAAARVRMLSPEQIAARLDDRFSLLTGGSRNTLPRQQTLRASINWSYDLLGTQERAVFRALGVFAGGWTLESAEAVLGAAVRKRILDLLSSLIDKSLVVVENPGPHVRYHMLETIRHYAQEKLAEARSAHTIRQAHARYFLALAKSAEPHLYTDELETWLDRLQAELDNLRAAFEWSSTHGTELAQGLEAAGLLWRFWELRGHVAEGRVLLEELLRQYGDVNDFARCYALHTAGNLAVAQGDRLHAQKFFEDCLMVAEHIGNRLMIGHMHNNLGNIAADDAEYKQAEDLYNAALVEYDLLDARWAKANVLINLGDVARQRGDYVRAQELYAGGLALVEYEHDKQRIALVLTSQSEVAWSVSDFENARALAQRALELYAQVEDKQGTGGAEHALGMVALMQGDYGLARKRFDHSLALARETDDTVGSAHALLALGSLARRQNDLPLALSRLREGLSLFQELGLVERIIACAEEIASILAQAEQLEKAARLLAAAQARRLRLGIPLAPVLRAGYERTLAILRDRLGEPAFARIGAVGGTLVLEGTLAEL